MSKRDRRALIILAIVAVAVGAFFFLTRGGGDEQSDAAPTPASPPPVVVEPTEPPARPPRFTFFSGRDPFEPLISDEVPEEGGGTTTDGTSTDGGETGNGTVTEPGEGAEEGSSGGATTSVGGHSVTLVDIFSQGGEELAQVEVDGETFLVSEGEEFAGSFKLVSIEGTCANMLFGDEAFTLCEGGERK